MKRIGLIALALLLALATAATAQQGRRHREFDDRIQTIRIWKLTEFLELDAATSAKLFPVMQQYEDQLAGLGEQKRELMQRIESIASSGKQPSPDEVNKLIEDSFAIDEKFFEVKRQEFRAVAKVLDPLRMVKFIAFDIRFMEEMQKIIYDLKHGGPPAGPPGPRMRGGQVNPGGED